MLYIRFLSLERRGKVRVVFPPSNSLPLGEGQSEGIVVSYKSFQTRTWNEAEVKVERSPLP